LVVVKATTPTSKVMKNSVVLVLGTGIHRNNRGNMKTSWLEWKKEHRRAHGQVVPIIKAVKQGRKAGRLVAQLQELKGRGDWSLVGDGDRQGRFLDSIRVGAGGRAGSAGFLECRDERVVGGGGQICNDSHTMGGGNEGEEVVGWAGHFVRWKGFQ
jgi:hypothetical protein